MVGEPCSKALKTGWMLSEPGADWPPFETEGDQSPKFPMTFQWGVRMPPHGTRNPEMRCHLGWEVKKEVTLCWSPKLQQTCSGTVESSTHGSGRVTLAEGGPPPSKTLPKTIKKGIFNNMDFLKISLGHNYALGQWYKFKCWRT